MPVSNISCNMTRLFIYCLLRSHWFAAQNVPTVKGFCLTQSYTPEGHKNNGADTRARLVIDLFHSGHFDFK